MEACHPQEVKEGQIELYSSGKGRAAATTAAESSADNEEDEGENSGGYGQDNQWEVKEILDRRTSGSGFAYHVSWVTRENDSNDTSW